MAGRISIQVDIVLLICYHVWMSETRFFIDAEFPDWDFVKPISIGIVSEHGESIYVEFSEGWGVHHCSEFVIEHVLPLLGPDDLRVSHALASQMLYRWILSKTQRPVFICDSHYDVDIMQSVLPQLIAKYELLRWDCRQEWDAFVRGQEAEFNRCGPHAKHHALRDAMALRSGVIHAGKTPSQYP